MTTIFMAFAITFAKTIGVLGGIAFVLVVGDRLTDSTNKNETQSKQ